MSLIMPPLSYEDRKEMLYTFSKLSEKGYTVIPIDEHKSPTLPTWSVYNKLTYKEMDKYLKHGIALCMGGEHKLTGLDFDLKYDLTGSLMSRYKAKVDTKVMKKMFVNATKNMGYHWVFSCQVCESNQVLAARATTPTEHFSTFIKVFGKANSLMDACRATVNDTKRVLIETRGEGGYIAIPPSYGYKHIYNDEIDRISFSEYSHLIEEAREFNEVFEFADRGYGSEDTIDAFNRVNSGLDILLKYGWEVTSERGCEIRLKRPGDVYSKDSAIYHKDNKTFWVFSTSSTFKNGQKYYPVDVLCVLEFGGDYRKMLKSLE